MSVNISVFQQSGGGRVASIQPEARRDLQW
jgi:hypothetical protein